MTVFVSGARSAFSPFPVRRFIIILEKLKIIKIREIAKIEGTLIKYKIEIDNASENKLTNENWLSLPDIRSETGMVNAKNCKAIPYPCQMNIRAVQNGTGSISAKGFFPKQ